jgi:uncharacterized membrane protein YecN with MAPEG domain
VTAESKARSENEAAAANARRRLLASSVWYTVPGTYAVVALAYSVFPPPSGLSNPSERLVFTVRWLLLAFLPYAAVCLLILHKRFVEGAHNPLAHSEGEHLRIHGRVMQNTLEQLVWFVLCTLVIATYLRPEQMRLVPIVCIFFALARLIYWRGYLRRGTLGRAPGVQLTFTLNISLLLGAIVLAVRSYLP